MCKKYGSIYCNQIKKSRGQLGDTLYLDEVFIKINGVLHYLWRAVDQDGDEIDILVQKCKDKKAAMRFFKRLLKGQGMIGLPIILHRQIFKNKDSSEEILYLISNDIELDKDAIETIYQKRWKVEVFHKNIKFNTALAKSPAKTIRTQSNPIFMSLLATVKLECLSIKKGLTTFGFKMKIYIKTKKSAIEALHREQASTA